MERTRIRRRALALLLAIPAMLGLDAMPALAEVVEVSTQTTVSAPRRVERRTNVTFNGTVTADDERCTSGVPVLVTKPTPVGRQVSRRSVVMTSAGGGFSYSKQVYRSGWWTFTFEGKTFMEGDTVITCLSSSVQVFLRAT